MAAEFETDFAGLDAPVRVELLAQVRRLKSRELDRAQLAGLTGASLEEIRELRLTLPHGDGDWRVALSFDTPRSAVLLLACEAAKHCGPGLEWILAEKAERRLRRHFARIQPLARQALAG
jgi:hypothetical protein